MFVSVAGTAIAASPIVRRALSGEAGRVLDGSSAPALMPPPGALLATSSERALERQPYALGPGRPGEFTTTCDHGWHAIAGGIEESSGSALAVDARPNVGGPSWRLFVFKLSATRPASGTVYAVCGR